MIAPQVLIIDDERNFRRNLAEALEGEGYRVAQAGTARAGLSLAEHVRPRVVLLDQNLPDATHVQVLTELRDLPVRPVVIVITAYAAYPRAVEAIKAGAFHYLAKPFDFADLLEALANASVRAGAPADPGPAGQVAALIGEHPSILELQERIVRIARSPVGAVLLIGESGTGKELVARAIHALSPRAPRRLLAVNCAALTETLLMSELFGHEKGAFTDAREQKKGVFEAAHGGTLFLDEVGEMGPRAQAALLRVLEQRSFTRVGGTTEVPVDVRIIAATNRPLEEPAPERAFRSDLYYRLNVVQLVIPPLRERGRDALLLARHFSEDIAKGYGEPPRALSPDAECLILEYSWPGNARQLRNAIERAYVVGPGPRITHADLPAELARSTRCPDAQPPLSPDALELPYREARQQLLDRFERRYLEQLMQRAHGNVTRAAEDAGMLRQVFQRLLARHGLHAEDFRR